MDRPEVDRKAREVSTDMWVLSPSSGQQAPRSHSEETQTLQNCRLTHAHSVLKTLNMHIRAPGLSTKLSNSALLVPAAPGWRAPFKGEVRVLELPQLLLHELLGPDLRLQRRLQLQPRRHVQLLTAANFPEGVLQRWFQMLEHILNQLAP